MSEHLSVYLCILIRFLAISCTTVRIHGRLLVKPQNHTVRVGSVVTLQCSTNSETVYWYCDHGSCANNPPDVQYIFMSNDIVPGYSGRIEILQSSPGHYDLYFGGINQDDVGRYTCYDPVDDEKAYAFIFVFDDVATRPFEGDHGDVGFADDINASTTVPTPVPLEVVLPLVISFVVIVIAVLVSIPIYRMYTVRRRRHVGHNEPTHSPDEGADEDNANGRIDNDEEEEGYRTTAVISQQEEASLTTPDNVGLNMRRRQEPLKGTSHGTFAEFQLASLSVADAEDEKTFVCDPLVIDECKCDKNEGLLSKFNTGETEHRLPSLCGCYNNSGCSSNHCSTDHNNAFSQYKQCAVLWCENSLCRPQR